MKETTESIGKWAEDTFGDTDGHIARIAARANEEMAELLRKATSDDAYWEDLVEESADVCIVLARLFWIYGTDLWEEVEKKMAVNRAREWKKDGTGHGYHVNTSGKIDHGPHGCDDTNCKCNYYDVRNEE